MTNNQIADTFEEIVELIENKIASISDIKFSSKEIYLMSFFLTIIQFGKSISSVIKSNNLIAISPLLRCQLEAYVDLLNLSKHDNYSKVLYAIHLEQKINMIEETFKDADNPFFKPSINKMGDRGETIKSLRKELDQTKQEIKSFEGNWRDIKKRFRYAGLGPVYASVYKLLCQDTHNNLISIENRHFHIEDGILHILSKSNWSIKDVASHIITSITIIESSVEYTFLNLELEKPLEILTTINKKQELLDSYFKEKYR